MLNNRVSALFEKCPSMIGSPCILKVQRLITFFCNSCTTCFNNSDL